MEIIQNYFITPIFSGEGYNLYNTLVYAGLALLSVYLLKKGSEEKFLKVDKDFFWLMIPVSILGGVLRALEDWRIAGGGHPNPLLITPGIYIFLAVLFFSVFFASKKLFPEEHLSITNRVFWSLSVGSLIAVLLAGIQLPLYFVLILSCAGAVSALIWFLNSAFLTELVENSQENFFCFFSHLLDAFASVIAVSIVPVAYFEQHLVSKAIISFGSPLLFVLLKIALVFVALKVAEEEGGKWEWTVKSAVLVLGLAPGTRDAIRILLGV